MSDSVRELIASEDLPTGYAEVVEQYWRPLAQYIARRRKPGVPLLVGINGAQGSGKSTLCRFLEVLLAREGLAAITLSLDDFYLTRAERKALAEEVHPLFVTRGVPGTHDLALIGTVLDGLVAGREVDAPAFNKAIDDREPRFRRIQQPVDVILFEGWCVGAASQEDAELEAPINALELDEDTQGTWRRAVNEQLRTGYAEIFRRLDLLVMLAVQDFSAVEANRRLQEEKLARSHPGGAAIMDEAALQRFIAHYERTTRHLLAEMPGRADVVFRLGPDQRPSALPAPLQG